MFFDDYGSATGGAVIGIFLPAIIAGTIVGVREKNWRAALGAMSGMVAGMFGVIKSRIDDEGENDGS